MVASTESATAAPSNGWGYGIADNIRGRGNAGVPDSAIDTFMARLAPKIYRVVIPYDVVCSNDSAAAGFLARTKQEIQFARSIGVQQVLATFTMAYRHYIVGAKFPTNAGPKDASVYRSCIHQAIADLNPYVEQWSPANEPNGGWPWFNETLDTSEYGPELLAQYYKALKDEIPAGDELVSPEFVPAADANGVLKLSDGTGSISLLRAWIRKYVDKVKSLTNGMDSGFGQHAAFHPYNAVASNNWNPIMNEFKSIVGSADIWFTEIGARIKGGNLPYPQLSQEIQMQSLVDYLKATPQVSRAYYWMPWNDGSPTWDSALVNNNGTPRAVWSTWCTQSRSLGASSTMAPCPMELTPPSPGFVLGSDEYRVSRSGSQSGRVSATQVAQRFKAQDVGIKSVSLALGVPSDAATISVYADAAQTQMLGTRTVGVATSGDTTAVFNPTIVVNKGQTYYLQAKPASPGGTISPTYSVYDEDYAAGGAQYNSDNSGFTGPDLNGRIATTSDVVPPTAPTNITATPELGGHDILVEWAASTDDVKMDRYEVYKDGVLYDSTTQKKLRVSGLNCLSSYTLRVVAKDNSGNAGPSSNFVVTTGACTPVVSISSPSTGQAIRSSAVSVAFAVLKNAATSVKCSLDGAGTADCTSPKSYSGLSQGAHSVTVTAVNSAGSHSMTVSFVVDSVPPVLTFTSPSAGTIGSQAIHVEASANEPITNKTCVLDGSTMIYGCEFADWTTDFATVGAHSIEVRATDLAGNPSSAQRSFTIDHPPVVTITAPTQGATLPSSKLTVTATADRPIVKAECDDGSFGLYASCDAANWQINYGWPFEPNSSHTVRVRVTDAAGNVGIGSRSFSVDGSTAYVSGGSWPGILGGTTIYFSATPSATVLAAGGGTSFRFYCGAVDCTDGYSWPAGVSPGNAFVPNNFPVTTIDNMGFVSTTNFSFTPTLGF